jgi:hypothetical protein
MGSADAGTSGIAGLLSHRSARAGLMAGLGYLFIIGPFEGGTG